MEPKDIGAEYVRGVEAGRKTASTLAEIEPASEAAAALREEIAFVKREIKRVGADYYTGPFLVGLRDGLEGA